MKRLTLVVTILTVFLTLGGTQLFAQRGGGNGGGMGRGMGGGGMEGNPGMGRGPSESRGMPPMNREGRMSTMRSHPNLSKQPANEVLSKNTKLASNLQSLLPAGTDLKTAASGFKNLGQFVAAVHVSHNLGISFNDLKSKTLAPGGNLGKAIHSLDPNVNSKHEAKRAKKQAKKDIKEAEKNS